MSSENKKKKATRSSERPVVFSPKKAKVESTKSDVRDSVPTLTEKMKRTLRWLLLHHVDYVKWCLNQSALRRLDERQHHHRGFAHIHQLSWMNRTTFIRHTRSTIDRFTHHHSDVPNDALSVYRCEPTTDSATNDKQTTDSNDGNWPPQLQEITTAEAMLTRLISPPLTNDTSRSDGK